MITDSYKYLKITLFYNEHVKHAADELYNKALKAMLSLREKTFKFLSISYKTKLKTIGYLIRPIVTYGSEVWIADYNINLNNIDLLPPEKLQHKFCKSVFGINRNSSNLAS